MVVLAALGLAACGDSKKGKSSTSAGAAKPAALSLSISESGKAAKFTAPASAKGGLVEVTLENKGKQPHAAQLIRLTGGHTPADAIKTVGGGSRKVPQWLRGEGGVSAVPPGKSDSATVVLTAGSYVIVDSGGPGSGPPAYTALKVTAGPSGELPSTPTTITAATAGKDRFKWQVSGELKRGDNHITFVSKGKDTLHFAGAFRVTGNPSLAQVSKALQSNGKPPKFVDQSSFTETTILDSGKSEIGTLGLRKPGQYVLFCPLSDRDGGKPHTEEGLLTKFTVK